MAVSRILLGFIGAGNMAEAIARGVLSSRLYLPEQLGAADLSADRRMLFAQDLKISTTADSSQVAGQSDILILAVKPQGVDAALEQIRPHLRADTLIISIVAAITTSYIEQALARPDSARIRVIRVMPNTPMLVGAGISALAKGSYATDADLSTAEKIFASAGKTVRAREAEMNAITAVSGSGPAYVFYFVEALTEAGVQLGLEKSQAALLARETVVGAAALLEKSPDEPAELRRKVTSPGGTTQAAISDLEASGFHSIIRKAVAAAEKRGKELSK